VVGVRRGQLLELCQDEVNAMRPMREERCTVRRAGDGELWR
jgi:hypothetical protein